VHLVEVIPSFKFVIAFIADRRDINISSHNSISLKHIIEFNVIGLLICYMYIYIYITHPMFHPVIQCKFVLFIDAFCTLNGFPGTNLHYCNFLCFQSLWQNFEMRLLDLSCLSVSPSVSPHGKTRLPLSGYA
jgi:hypothetical protein